MRLCYEYKYTYDESGLLLKQENIEYDEKGNREETDSSEYTYEKEDNKLIMIDKESGMRTEFEYDENNKQIKFVVDYFDPDYDNGDYYYEYVYNTEGKKTAQIGYDSDHVKWGQGEVVYDTDGKMIEETWVEEEGYYSPYSSFTEYKYDENDKLIEVHLNDENHYPILIEYEYDDKNQLQFIEKHENRSRERFEYDSNGNLVVNKSEYSFVAEPPVQCGESHLSRLTEPLLLLC